MQSSDRRGCHVMCATYDRKGSSASTSATHNKSLHFRLFPKTRKCRITDFPHTKSRQWFVLPCDSNSCVGCTHNTFSERHMYKSFLSRGVASHSTVSYNLYPRLCIGCLHVPASAQGCQHAMHNNGNEWTATRPAPIASPARWSWGTSFPCAPPCAARPAALCSAAGSCGPQTTCGKMFEGCTATCWDRLD